MTPTASFYLVTAIAYSPIYRPGYPLQALIVSNFAKKLHEVIKRLVFFLEAQHQFQVALNHRHGGVLGFILIMGDVSDQF